MSSASWRFMLSTLLLQLHVVFAFQPLSKAIGFVANTEGSITQSSGGRNFDLRVIRRGVVSHDYIDRDSYPVYMFYLLMIYRDREGHVNVPHSHVEDGWRLGVWLSRQREAKKLGTLEPVLEGRLDQAGVVWDAHADKWARNFQLLVQFKERENHCNVPQFHKEDGSPLGTWLNTQRKAYSAGKLMSCRQKKLEKIGVVWKANNNNWDSMFDLLIRFKNREGHCRVPIYHKEDGKNLGSWVATQRKFKRRNTLSDRRKELLENAGLEWDVAAEQWNKMFQLMIQFVEREDHTRVPIDHKENGMSLGHWLAKQKQFYKAGKLDANRQRRLEDIGVLDD